MSRGAEHSYKPEFLVGGLIIAWQVLLIAMFSYSGIQLFIPVLAGLVFAGLGIWLAGYFHGRKHRSAGLILGLLSIFYLQLITMPADEFDSRPAEEVRSAISILGNFRSVSQEVLLQKHEPPYAPVTAALHKYKEELPEHSWLITFGESDDSETPYLFNIRNNTAAHNHPGVRHAELTEHHLVLEIEKSGTMVRYDVPLNENPPAFSISGEPGLPSPAGSFQATVYPHLLSVENHNRFQQYFYRLLNRIYS